MHGVGDADAVDLGQAQIDAGDVGRRARGSARAPRARCSPPRRARARATRARRGRRPPGRAGGRRRRSRGTGTWSDRRWSFARTDGHRPIGGGGRAIGPADRPPRARRRARDARADGDSAVRRALGAASASARGDGARRRRDGARARPLRALRPRLRALPRLRTAGRDGAARRSRGGSPRSTFRSPSLGGRTERALVYLPAAYRRQPGLRFPVAYLLHGTPGDPRTAFVNSLHVAPRLDLLILRHRVRPLIVVMPPGSPSTYDRATEWANGPARDAHWFTYLTHDLIHAVDGHLRTIRNASGRGIGGYSSGADAALNAILLRPAPLLRRRGLERRLPPDARDGRARRGARAALLGARHGAAARRASWPRRARTSTSTRAGATA